MNRIKFLFAWYDFWVGIYYDRKGHALYFFPVPMLGFVIDCEIYYEIYAPSINEVVGRTCTSGVGDVDSTDVLRRISKAKYMKDSKQ